jgi:hypothetical protein
VYAYLQLQRRGYGFFGNPEDYKITAVQNNMAANALSSVLHPNTLQRLTNTRMYGNGYSVADVMGDLTKAIFDADMAGNVSVYRQYVQTQFVQRLANIIADKSGYDDVSEAAARYTLKKIKAKLAAAGATANEETKAHRTNLIFLIDNATVVK